jgi:hypothetical protein
MMAMALALLVTVIDGDDEDACNASFNASANAPAQL